jgi:hypothetical protein
MRRLIIGMLAAALCLVACDSGSNTGAGGTDAGANAEEWASQLCGVLLEARDAWPRPLRNAQAEVASMTGRFEPRRVRRVLVRAISETLSLEDETIERVDALGAPNADRGDEVQRALLAMLAEVRAVTTDARDRARALPVDTPDHFFASMEVFSSDFGDELAAAFFEFDPEADLGEIHWEGERPEACESL